MRPNAIRPPGVVRCFCLRGQEVLLFPRVAPVAAGGGGWTALLDRKTCRCRPLGWRPTWACRCHSVVQDGVMAIPKRGVGLEDDSRESSLYPSLPKVAIIWDKDDGQECKGLKGHEEAGTDGRGAYGSRTIDDLKSEDWSATPEEETITALPSEESDNDEESEHSDDDAANQEYVLNIANSLQSGQMEDSEFVELNDAILSKVVKQLGKDARHLKVAEEVVKRAIRLHRVSDRMLSNFFKSCGIQDRLDVMQASFVKWLRQDHVIYGQKSVTAMITSCVRNSKLELGKEIVRELMDHSRPVGTSTFNALIQGFCRAEKIEESLELFDWLQCSDLQHADKRTYQTLLWGMRRSDKLGSLRMAYESFLAEGWEMDSMMYFAFMTTAGAAKDASFAEQVLELFKKGSAAMDCKVLNMYLHVLSQSARFPSSLDAVLEMYSSLGEEPDVYTFTSLLTAAYKSYQGMDVIDRLVEEIRKSELVITPVTSCAAIIGYKNCTADPPAERFERAQRVFDITEDKNRACYHLLMSLYAENMDLAAAIRLLNEMEVVGLPPNSRSYKTLEQACTEAGLVGYAKKYEKLWKQALEGGEAGVNVRTGKNEV